MSPDIELSRFDAATLRSDDDSVLSKIDHEADIAGDETPELVNRLFTPLLLDKTVPPVPLDSERKPLPIYTASWLSRGFFWWLIPLLSKGYKRTIQQEDLWYLGDDNRIETLYPAFQKNLNALLAKHYRKNPESDEWPSNVLFWAIIHTFKYQYLFAAVCKWTSALSESLAPLVTKHLIQYIADRYSDNPPPVGHGVGLAIGLSLMTMAATLLNNHAYVFCGAIGSQSRALLTKAMLERIMVGTAETRQKFPSGVVLGYMGADLERIDEGITNSFMILGFPVSVVVGLTLLIINLKVSALAGIGVFFASTALCGPPAILMFKLRNKINVQSDKRIALMRQIVQSMKIIKLYSWENAYEKMMHSIRAKEVSFIYQMHAVLAVVFSLAFSVSAFTAMSAFLVSYALNGLVAAAVIFSSLSLFNVLSLQVANAAFAMPMAIDAMTATKRIGKFLQAPTDSRTKEDIYDADLITDPSVSIQLEDASFKWNVWEEEKKDDEKKKDKHKAPTFIHKENKILNNINFQIEKGEFIIVTGSTGSGKSSVLAALAGLMEQTNGSMGINGDFLLCGTTWVQNTTIKENILFGEQFDSEHYKNVLYACALDGDLDSFKACDMTQVGDRGVTLSGGQKARINLARTVYRGADIYLLDDVISALDAKVGKQVVERCILGELSQSTRVLATNNLDLLKRADRIIFLNGDGTVDIGTEEELKFRNVLFLNLIDYQKGGEGKLKDKSHEMIEERLEPINPSKAFKEEEGQIVVDEERAVNAITLKTYSQYLHAAAAGPFFYVFILGFALSALLGHFCVMFANVWLSYWLEQKFDGLSNRTYINYYLTLTFCGFIFPVIEIGLIGLINARSSKSLNLAALHRVLRAPMAFIDTTPVGRIMNRFSHDTNMLDNEIGNQLKMMLFQTGILVATIILAIIYVPWFALIVPFVLFMFMALTNFSQATGREVKRLEAINRSFIFSNFNEVVDGLDTIKSFGTETRYLDTNDTMVNRLNEVRLVFLSNQKWLANALTVLASFSVMVITLMAATGVFELGPATVGLLVTYIVEFANICMDILTTWAELENQMNSVERVCHYAYNLEQEPAYIVNGITPPPTWPQDGSIEMSRVVMRYRPELPVTLKSLSVSIGGSEKIGICGRTGAGKSSLMNALFRLNELDSGSIVIDGYDISTLGLHQLRSQLSIIPQDPVLFQGTVRSNLDPFGERSDDELWGVLRRGGLIKSNENADVNDASSHKFHLDAVVSGDGSNFSLGESQLIALARALVRNSKILVMDEATSSVDFETDALIQSTITREFKECTILCIAHRLKTILNYDRILVLDKGALEEFDTPERLFHKQGRFREMCDNAGITAGDFET